jgi:hypothetical protein
MGFEPMIVITKNDSECLIKITPQWVRVDHCCSCSRNRMCEQQQEERKLRQVSFSLQKSKNSSNF